MDSWTKQCIRCSPDHELGFSRSGHSDSCGQHVRVAWAKYAMRPDGNGSESIRVSCQDSLQVTSQHKHAKCKSSLHSPLKLQNIHLAYIAAIFLHQKYTLNWCSWYRKILQCIKCLSVWSDGPLLRRGGSTLLSSEGEGNGVSRNQQIEDPWGGDSEEGRPTEEVHNSTAAVLRAIQVLAASGSGSRQHSC